MSTPSYRLDLLRDVHPNPVLLAPEPQLIAVQSASPVVSVDEAIWLEHDLYKRLGNEKDHRVLCDTSNFLGTRCVPRAPVAFED